MFEMGPPTTTAQLRDWVSSIGRLEHARTDAERVERIRLLEELKSAAAAVQAVETVAFAEAQERRQRESGLPSGSVGKGVGSQVGLAKRESPARAQRYLGWSRVLTRELPGTFEALAEGRITEWRAQIVARETIWLSAEHRLAADAEVADKLEGWGDRRVEAEVKKIAYRLDPKGYVERSAGRAKDRRVTVRPAPETMSYLTGYLPVGQGVAVFASLKACADALRAQGDERSRDQIMADTLVERVTGQATAEAVPVEVSLVMTDQALFNAGDGAQEPAHVGDFGPVPAELARRLLLGSDATAQAWVRRIYTDPETGQLAAIDARRRFFDGAVRRLLIARDQWCRTPWCDAPIRHADHVVPVAGHGETELVNGQGLCEACNQAKEAPGWRARPVDETGSEVETTTPTGHRYRSRPPDPPRTRQPEPPPRSHVEVQFSRVIVDAA
jgi:hypothetical protein